MVTLVSASRCTVGGKVRDCAGPAASVSGVIPSHLRKVRLSMWASIAARTSAGAGGAFRGRMLAGDSTSIRGATMPATIPLERLVNELLELYDETFDRVHGYYLNRGTSLFETLATISAETASIPVSADCATLAAQVAHVR